MHGEKRRLSGNKNTWSSGVRGKEVKADGDRHDNSAGGG